MCNLQHQNTQLPGGAPVGDAPQQTGTLPMTGEPTQTTQTPTKFNKLLKVLVPLAVGAGVGATGGNWKVPGSGQQAAQQYFGQQAELGLRQKQMAQELAVQQNLGQYRQAQMGLDQARTAALDRQTDQGKWSMMETPQGPRRVNAQTGENNPLLDSSGQPIAGKPEPKKLAVQNTPDGTYVVDEDSGTAKQVKTDQGIPLEPPKSQESVPTKNDENAFVDQYFNDNKLSRTSANMLKARAAWAAAGQAPERPERPPRTLMEVPNPDGTSKIIEATPGTVLPAGAKTPTQAGAANKPSADEERRSDMAENMNENLDQLEGIVDRRPDLFGPIAGRLTGARATVGTGDPDIASLNAIKEMLGMAQVSAHGMRSGGVIEQASQSLLNGFHNEPKAMKAAIAAARGSVKTFSDDVERKTGPGPATAPSRAVVSKPKVSAGAFKKGPDGVYVEQ
jgi:hypothetical protein